MTRRLLPCALLCLLPAIAFAQQTQTITVRTVGGFLGQAEGFCEDPGGPYDDAVFAALNPCTDADARSRSVGGVIGAMKALATPVGVGPSYTVISPNNSARGNNELFESAMRTLRPSAIGIGANDLERLIRGRDATAQNVDMWVKQGLPLLASNLAVRDRGHVLNVKKRGRYSLHIPDDESIGWTEPIALEGPGDETPVVRLTERPSCHAEHADTGAEHHQLTLKQEGKDFKLNIEDYVRPGQCYDLTITDSSNDHPILSFQTDAALTPIHDEVPSLDGLPSVADHQTGIVIASLVDPSAKGVAAADSWKWQYGGREHELIFNDPLDVTRWLLARVRTARPTPAPGLLILSDLSDGTTGPLLDKVPEIRIIILHPESALLGRANDPTDGKDPSRYSGDLAFTGTVDRKYPVATRLLLRPEWFGETLLTARAQLSSDGGHMLLADPTVDVEVVNGATLRMGSAGADVTYAAEFDGRTELGKRTRYTDCDPTSTIDRCVQFAALWDKDDTIRALVGDAARQALHTDLSVIPKSVVDPDYSLWVRTRLESQKRSDWMSGYLLDRLLYKSPRMVRAYVPGADLPDVLLKIIKSDDESYCVLGSGGGCSPPIQKAHPSEITVNGRRISPRLIYSIGMPAALAEKLDLGHDDADRGRDLIEMTDQHLSSNRWYAAHPSDARIVDRQQRHWNNRLDGYWAMSSLDLGLAKVMPKDPGADGADVRSNLQVPFAGTKESRSLTVAVDSDLAVVDLPRWAVRFPMTLDYKRKDQGGSVSYDTDEFSMGGQVDRKLAILGDTRVFVGLFADGAVRPHEESLKASRHVSSSGSFETRESATFETTYLVEPSRYKHVAFGGELRGFGHFTTGPVSYKVKTLALQWAYGHETRAPYGVSIGDETQEIADYFTLGPQKLLGQFFAANPAAFSSATRFEILTRRQQQQRPEVNAEGTVAYKAGKREYTADIEVRVRKYIYGGEAPSDFSLTLTQKYDIKFAVPLFWRFKLVPHYQYQRAAIAAHENGIFSVHTVDVTASLPFVVRWGHGTFVK